MSFTMVADLTVDYERSCQKDIIRFFTFLKIPAEPQFGKRTSDMKVSIEQKYIIELL